MSRGYPLRVVEARRQRQRQAEFLGWCEQDPPRTPQHYGLTAECIRCEANRLLAGGAQPWEIRLMLVAPERVSA